MSPGRSAHRRSVSLLSARWQFLFLQLLSLKDNILFFFTFSFFSLCGTFSSERQSYFSLLFYFFSFCGIFPGGPVAISFPTTSFSPDNPIFLCFFLLLFLLWYFFWWPSGSFFTYNYFPLKDNPFSSFNINIHQNIFKNLSSLLRGNFFS